MSDEIRTKLSEYSHEPPGAIFNLSHIFNKFQVYKNIIKLFSDI
jgi:hypothetical protein